MIKKLVLFLCVFYFSLAYSEKGALKNQWLGCQFFVEDGFEFVGGSDNYLWKFDGTKTKSILIKDETFDLQEIVNNSLYQDVNINRIEDFDLISFKLANKTLEIEMSVVYVISGSEGHIKLMNFSKDELDSFLQFECGKD